MSIGQNPVARILAGKIICWAILELIGWGPLGPWISGIIAQNRLIARVQAIAYTSVINAARDPAKTEFLLQYPEQPSSLPEIDAAIARLEAEDCALQLQIEKSTTTYEHYLLKTKQLRCIEMQAALTRQAIQIKHRHNLCPGTSNNITKIRHSDADKLRRLPYDAARLDKPLDAAETIHTSSENPVTATYGHRPDF